METNTFLALTYSKIIVFFKILKTDDDLNKVAKFVKQLFSKPHFDASVKMFFATSPKFKILIKKNLK
jgi:hypothetical protein